MNYIELINNFWQVRRVKGMTAYEADLYYYLLKECNSRMWLNPFELPTNLICAEIGISRKTLVDLRNRLSQRGLISFREGNRNKNGAVYKLMYVSESNIQGNVLGNLDGNIQGNVLGNPLKNKLNKTKLNQTEDTPLTPQGELFKPPASDREEKKKKGKKELLFDFVEVAFKPVFMRFIEYRKEIGKPFKSQKGVEGCYAELKKLSGNNVQKAELIVQQSISNEYQGLFPLKKNVDVPAEKLNDQLGKFAERVKNLSNG